MRQIGLREHVAEEFCRQHEQRRARERSPDGPAPADNRGERDADRQGQKEEVVGF